MWRLRLTRIALPIRGRRHKRAVRTVGKAFHSTADSWQTSFPLLPGSNEKKKKKFFQRLPLTCILWHCKEDIFLVPGFAIVYFWIARFALWRWNFRFCASRNHHQARKNGISNSGFCPVGFRGFIPGSYRVANCCIDENGVDGDQAEYMIGGMFA